MVLAPALLDSYRCYHPEATWAVWSSRGIKTGMMASAFLVRRR